MNTASKTKILVEGAVMIALGTILSFIKLPGPWVNGGSITAFSMLPLCLFAFKYGTKWGLLAGVANGVLQLLFGMDGLKGISLLVVFGAVVIDYLLAFGALGLAGVFKGVIKNTTAAFCVGAFFATTMRFLCHFTSGFLLWSDLLADGFAAVTFSFGYNIGYMGPEILLTTLGAFLVTKSLFVRKRTV